MEKGYVYFPGLNGIRAIAAVLVIFAHVNQFAYLFRLSELYTNIDIGAVAVTIFFVLSGFLITYLLIEEKQQFGKISLPKFYARRIFRIWPLYYAVIILSVVLYPYIFHQTKDPNFKTILLLHIFFLPNYAFATGFEITPMSPLWSIGVEEQFYLLWPVLMRKGKSLLQISAIFIIFIIIYFIIKTFLRFYNINFWYSFISTTRIDCMALGGLGACLIKANSSKWLHWVYHPVTQLVGWAMLIYSIVVHPIHVFSFIDNEINAIMALIIILNTSTNPKPLVSLENRLMDYLGKISYGLYAWHMLVICILAWLFKGIAFPDNFAMQFGMFLFILLATIALASISYYAFELKFIKLKKHFTKVISRNSLTEESAAISQPVINVPA